MATLMFRRFVSYWAPPILWAAGIFGLSSISLPPKPPLLPGLDKIAHAGLYATLAYLLFRALFRERGLRPWRAAAWAFLLTALYGVTDEFHQQFVPGRFPGADDLVADTLGGLCAVLIDRTRQRWTSRRSRANTLAGD